MPARSPGATYPVAATKEVTHGNPAMEKGHAGIAHKSTQIAAGVPNTATAEAAKKIIVGEQMVINMSGAVEFPSSLLPGGAKAGDRLYIKESNNKLLTAKEGEEAITAKEAVAKFGLIDEIDTTAGRAHVNLSQRSSW